MITKEEFIAWKNNKVTEAFFAAISSKREDIKETIVQTAGEDSVRDAIYRGYCVAMSDVLDVNLDGVFEENDD